MARETGLYLDSKEFDKKFERLVKKAIPEDAGKGMITAMDEVLSDSIELPPQAPKEIGDLWGSIAGTVKLKVIYKILRVIGGFNISYARKHHEAEPGTYRYTTDKGSEKPGVKFMQTKMSSFRNKYMGIVAETIRKRGR